MNQPIAIDVMSGDRTPRDYVAGVAQALQDDSAMRALMVGDPAAIEGALNGASRAGIRRRVEIAARGDSPQEALLDAHRHRRRERGARRRLRERR
jgi:fatty acid/phospholipid biosynthesis enzyme